MNYIFQTSHHPYQCGSYAIYNLLVNRKCNRNHKISLHNIIYQCKATKENGTLMNDFKKTLATLNIDVTIKQDVTIRMIKDIHKPIIILFHWYEYAKEGNHYALLDEQYKDEYGAYKFRIINYSFDKPIQIITERELKSMLMPYETESFKMPTIWY